MGDVVLKIEDIDTIVLDATDGGDDYQVEFKRIDEINFEQTVIGEGICPYCGDSEDECKCEKIKAIIAENILLDYFNNTFSTTEDVIAIINGIKYRKA